MATNGNGHGNGNGHNGNGNGYGNGSSLDIRYILEVMFRRKWWILTTAIVVFGVSLYMALNQSTYYTASTVIEFVDNDLDIKEGNKTAKKNDAIQLFQQRLGSNSYIEKVAKKLGLLSGTEEPKAYEIALSNIKKTIAVYPLRGSSSIFSLVVTSTSPVIAKDMVDNLLTMYLEEDSVERRQELATSIDFISAQLENYYQKLQEGEAKLREMKQKRVAAGESIDSSEALSKLIDMPGMYKFGTERMADMQFKLVEMDTELAVLSERKSLLENERLKAEQGKTVLIDVENPKVTSLKQTLAGYEQKLEDLLVTCKEEHPMVIELRKNIAYIQERIKTEKAKPFEGTQAISAAWNEINKRIQEVDVKIEETNTKKREAMILINVYGKNTRGMNRDDIEMIQLIRNNQINQTLTELLLGRLESLKVTQQLEVASGYVPFRVLDEVRLPQTPLKKKTSQLILMGLFMSLMLAGGVGYGLDLLDQSVRKEQEVAKILDIPVLGSIPEFRAASGSFKYKKQV